MTNLNSHYNLRAITDLSPGDHWCWLYESEEEYRALLAVFLQHGLEQRQKVLCIFDAYPEQSIVDSLCSQCPQLALGLASGQVSFIGSEAAYLKNGVFDPEQAIDFLTQATGQALAEGYAALRVTGEMSWVTKKPPGSDKLLDYEVMCHQFFKSHPCLAICQYPRSRFDPALLLQVVMIHPTIIIGTEVFDNVCYIPPFQATAQNSPKIMLNHYLDNLVDRKRAEAALRDSEELYRVTLSNISDAIFVTNEAGDFTYICPNAHVIFGYSTEEIEAIGNIYQLIGSNFLTRETLNDVEELRNIEQTITDKDGRTHHLLINAKQVAINQGVILFTCRDITERKRYEDKISYYAARTEALARILQALARVSRNPQTVFETITHHIAEAIGDACVLALLSDDKRWLKPVAFHHSNPAAKALMHNLLTAAPQNTKDDQIAGILNQGNTVLVPVIAREDAYEIFQPEYWPYLEQIGISSLLMIPLQLEGQMIGTLGVTRDANHLPYTLDDQTFLQELADRAALSIDNARLFEAEHKHRLQAETLREATLALISHIDLHLVLDEILDQVKRIVPYQTASIMLLKNDNLRAASWRGYDKYGSEAFIASLNQSLNDFPLDRSVIQNRQPRVIHDTRHEPDWIQLPELNWIRSHIAFPIHAHEQVLGLLRLDGSAPGEFSGQDLERLQPLAAAAAIALENTQLFDQLHAHREELRQLYFQLVQVQESERRHIARELHDEVGQILTGLKLILDMALGNSLAKELKDGLCQAQALVQELIEQVDEMSLDLRPAMLDDLGLLSTLLWHFERFNRHTAIQIDFKHMGLEGRRFAPALETTVYRIIQESLTNVARHAGVSKATVRVWVNQDIIGIQVEDEGRGFDFQQAQTAGNSNGLSGMRERVELLNGNISIMTAPAGGVTLTVELPLYQ